MRKFLLLPAILAASIAVVPALSPASAAGPNGATLFAQRCGSCHSVQAGAPATIAPNLAGVVGRKAATGNFRYSSALKASGLTWTKQNLNTFLSGPGKMVPGTRMVITIHDTAQRKAIIDFLASTSK